MASRTENPLLQSWTQPFGVPPFQQIAPDHFEPAFDVAMAEHNAEIAAIVEDLSPATFDNTVLALERAGEALERVSLVFHTLARSRTSPAIQAVERSIAPKLAAHYNAIATNPELFARFEVVARASETDPKLTAEDRRLVERVQRNFIRAGARLEGAARARNSEITRRLAELATAFSQNVLADQDSWVLELTSDADLAGLPDDLIEAARSAARELGLSAPYAISLSRSFVEPFLTHSKRPDLRKAVFDAWVARGANGNANDNRALILEILQLRAERARLLGFATFADYKLEVTMAETPARVRELHEAVWDPARTQANKDAEKLAEIARADGLNGPLDPADWRYYAEKLRSAEFNIDDAEVKPYFSLDTMIQAAFEVANRLFGLSFKPVAGLDLYHPDVRAWEVQDAEGRHVGLFLGDYFARPSKQSGAWMSSLRRQSKLDGDVRPIVLNTCNFVKPPAGGVALLSLEDARTLFHEFGHGLHGLLSDVTYGSLSGTSVSTDFVELPSQLFEHWLMTDAVLTEFARHYRTGEAMPAGLREKLRAAQNFNQGFRTVEYLASSIVDLELHAREVNPADDPIAIQDSILEQIGMPDAIVMRHALPHFLHLFSSGSYAAGYYSYLWSEVLDADAFRAFEETGDVFDREVADRLKQYIYSAGGSRKEDEAYTKFRGRVPTVDGLLAKRGFVAGDLRVAPGPT